MINKLYIISFLIFMYSNICYSTNKFTLADSYLKNGEFELAIQEYDKILQYEGDENISKNIEAITGKAICLYELGEYKKSFSICKNILKLEIYNSTAIFYAGKNLEAMENSELAQKLYNYYKLLDRNDPYRYFIKARHELIKEKATYEKIDFAIQDEGSETDENINDYSVSVLYFVNTGSYSTWDILSKGLTEIINTDLRENKDLEVTSRSELQALLNKLKFDLKELSNEDLYRRLAKLLKSQYIVSGSFSVDNNQMLTVSLGILNTLNPDMIEYTEISDKIKNIHKIEKRIVDQILTEMDVYVSPKVKKRINKYHTKNLDAFIAYSRGLDLLDFGNVDGAYSNFSLAIKLDSRFFLAHDIKTTIDAFLFMEQNNMGKNHCDIIKTKRKFRSPVQATINNSIVYNRLQNVLLNLDLGYLPGNEARKGPEGYDPWNIQINKKLLPEPPNPPSK